jgi:hypothetical protein
VMSRVSFDQCGELVSLPLAVPPRIRAGEQGNRKGPTLPSRAGASPAPTILRPRFVLEPPSVPRGILTPCGILRVAWWQSSDFVHSVSITRQQQISRRCSSVVEQQFCKLLAVGSSPTTGFFIYSSRSISSQLSH